MKKQCSKTKIKKSQSGTTTREAPQTQIVQLPDSHYLRCVHRRWQADRKRWEALRKNPDINQVKKEFIKDKIQKELIDRISDSDLKQKDKNEIVDRIQNVWVNNEDPECSEKLLTRNTRLPEPGNPEERLLKLIAWLKENEPNKIELIPAVEVIGDNPAYSCVGANDLGLGDGYTRWTVQYKFNEQDEVYAQHILNAFDRRTIEATDAYKAAKSPGEFSPLYTLALPEKDDLHLEYMITFLHINGLTRNHKFRSKKPIHIMLNKMTPELRIKFRNYMIADPTRNPYRAFCAFVTAVKSADPDQHTPSTDRKVNFLDNMAFDNPRDLKAYIEDRENPEKQRPTVNVLNDAKFFKVVTPQGYWDFIHHNSEKKYSFRHDDRIEHSYKVKPILEPKVKVKGKGKGKGKGKAKANVLEKNGSFSSRKGELMPRTKSKYKAHQKFSHPKLSVSFTTSSKCFHFIPLNTGIGTQIQSQTAQEMSAPRQNIPVMFCGWDASGCITQGVKSMDEEYQLANFFNQNVSSGQRDWINNENLESNALYLRYAVGELKDGEEETLKGSINNEAMARLPHPNIFGLITNSSKKTPLNLMEDHMIALQAQAISYHFRKTQEPKKEPERGQIAFCDKESISPNPNYIAPQTIVGTLMKVLQGKADAPNIRRARSCYESFEMMIQQNLPSSIYAMYKNEINEFVAKNFKEAEKLPPRAYHFFKAITCNELPDKLKWHYRTTTSQNNSCSRLRKQRQQIVENYQGKEYKPDQPSTTSAGGSSSKGSNPTTQVTLTEKNLGYYKAYLRESIESNEAGLREFPFLDPKERHTVDSINQTIGKYRRLEANLTNQTETVNTLKTVRTMIVSCYMQQFMRKIEALERKYEVEPMKRKIPQDLRERIEYNWPIMTLAKKYHHHNIHIIFLKIMEIRDHYQGEYKNQWLAVLKDSLFSTLFIPLSKTHPNNYDLISVSGASTRSSTRFPNKMASKQKMAPKQKLVRQHGRKLDDQQARGKNPTRNVKSRVNKRKLPKISIKIHEHINNDKHLALQLCTLQANISKDQKNQSDVTDHNKDLQKILYKIRMQYLSPVITYMNQMITRGINNKDAKLVKLAEKLKGLCLKWFPRRASIETHHRNSEIMVVLLMNLMSSRVNSKPGAKTAAEDKREKIKKAPDKTILGAMLQQLDRSSPDYYEINSPQNIAPQPRPPSNQISASSSSTSSASSSSTSSSTRSKEKPNPLGSNTKTKKRKRGNQTEPSKNNKKPTACSSVFRPKKTSTTGDKKRKEPTTRQGKKAETKVAKQRRTR